MQQDQPTNALSQEQRRQYLGERVECEEQHKAITTLLAGQTAAMVSKANRIGYKGVDLSEWVQQSRVIVDKAHMYAEQLAQLDQRIKELQALTKT